MDEWMKLILKISINSDQNKLPKSFNKGFYIYFDSHMNTNSIGNHFWLLILGSLD